MIKVIISGCCGKMGRRIIALILKDNDFRLVGATENNGSPAVGQKLSRVLGNPILNLEVKSNTEDLKEADLLIDFTTPSATSEHLSAAIKFKKPVVIGTTGLDLEQTKKIETAAKEIPIVFSPNMSVGVNVLFRLVKDAAEKLSNDYKIDIIEAHHVHKKDAPSGTAKHLAAIIKGVPARRQEHVKIESIREDEIIGDHQVHFSSPRDVITIKHKARTRDIFAQGALEAAKFIVKQASGLYSMQNVIEGKQ